MHRSNAETSGFTLIEILLAVSLISAVMVVMFAALSAVRENARRIETLKEDRKSVYLVYHALHYLFKSMSAVEVFNSRNRTPFFFGDDDEMVFISKHPLVFPYRVPHVVGLRLHIDRLEYLEAFLDVRQNFLSFDILRGEPHVLMRDIRRVDISYLVWDDLLKREEWKRAVNTFEGDGLPSQILLEISTKTGEERMLFRRQIFDTYDEIPEAFFK